MKRLKFSIRTKVLLLLASLLVVIFGVFTFVFVQNTVHSLRQSLTTEAQSFAALATEPIGKTFQLYKDSGRVRIDQQVGQFTQLSPTIIDVAIYGIDGSVAYQQNSQPLPSVSEAQASSFTPEYIHGSGGKLVAIMQPFIEDNGIHRNNILYLVSNSEIDESIRSGVLTIIAFASLAVVLVGAALFIAMNQFLLKPIRRVSQAALRISAGELDKEIPEERKDEIGDLASSVNTMADSLKSDISKLKEADKLKSEFMMITSHNLRTPLTVMNGYLETMKAAQLPPEITKMVNTVAANSKRLSNLAEDILTVSEIEAGRKLSGNPESLGLTAITKEIAATAEQLAVDHQLAFTYDAPSRAINIVANRHHLRIAIWNLLDNAIKFTKPGGTVSLGVSVEKNYILIKVADTGIGIEPEEVAKLFTKFHRGTSIMEYNYEGTGIGLYISRLIIREFGGDITMSSVVGKGSIFAIWLPLREGRPGQLPTLES